MSKPITPRSNVNTLLKELRVRRAEAAAAGDAKKVKKIDFIGKSINALLDA